MASPLLTGWELITVADRSELVGATASLPARPWHLALIAFSDESLDPSDPSASTLRELTAAATDGRLVTATLRFDRDEREPAILASRVTTRLEDLGRSAPLAWGLRAALGSTADVTPTA
jgi:predicted LPLAT superfamily acyltransferase